jgi:hypothetical protein
LQRTVRSRAGARTLELGRGRQEIRVVLAIAEDRPRGRVRVGYDEQLECCDAFRRLRHTGDRVAAVAEDDHRLQLILLRDLVFGQHRRVEPAGRRNARCRHDLWIGEARDEPVVVSLPDARPMTPGAFGEAVVQRERNDIEADVRRALHVAVTAEDVRAVAAAVTDVTGREQQRAERADVRRADGVLGRAHAPHER